MTAVHSPEVKTSRRVQTDTLGAEASPLPGGGDSPLPITETLPDLSRLSIGQGKGAPVAGQTADSSVRPPCASGENTSPSMPAIPGHSVHITVHAHASSVTINAGPVAAPRNDHGGLEARGRVAAPIHALSPGRRHLVANALRAGNTAAAPGPTSAAVSPAVGPTTLPPLDVHATPAVPAPTPAPGVIAAEDDAYDVVPPSPELESLPASPEVVPAALPPVTAVGYPPEDDDEYIAPNDPQHRRWYVVTAGKKVGIWRTWLDISDYVNGVSGNAHQSFKRRAEAEEYYYGAKEAGHVFMLE